MQDENTLDIDISKLKERVERLVSERRGLEKQIIKTSQGLAFLREHVEKNKTRMTLEERLAIVKVIETALSELRDLKEQRESKNNAATDCRKIIREHVGSLPKPRFLINPRANKGTVNNPQKRTQ